MIPTWAYALACCAGAAILETLFAGPGVREQIREIKMPRFAPPFWGWIAIGLAYYVMTFWLFTRLFQPPVTAARVVALCLLAGVLFMNALWNLFFFRRRDFGPAFGLSLFYSVVALCLFLVLLFADKSSALILLPYILYLGYANCYGYWVWRLNEKPRS